MATNYISSTETTNFARLCRLVIDICSDLLRAVLNAKLPPPGLKGILQSQRVHLYKNIEPRQRQVLFPQGGVFTGSLEDLDFTLLYRLIINIQGINIPPHQNGWGRTPDNVDRSLSANIDRLREQRNEAYGHLPTASLTDAQLTARWDDIHQSVSEIAVTLTGDNFVTAVDNLRTAGMDPDTEKTYIQELGETIQLGVRDDVTDVKSTLNVLERNTSRKKELSPKIEAMIETTKAMLEEKIRKRFIVTKGFHDAKEKLQQNRIVVIKGNTGDGKTATAIQLLHWMITEQEGRQPLQLTNMKDFDMLAPNSQSIVFIDDIFREKVVCQKDVGEWNKRINSVIPKKLCGEKESLANFLVITVRNEIFNSLKKCSLGKVFTDGNIIDLSSNTYNIYKEKMDLLDLYEPKGVKFTWTWEEKQEILACAPAIGFPQCCCLFRDIPEVQKERENFFEKPLHFLNEALSRLGECSALLFLFLNGGIVQATKLDPNSEKIDKNLLEEAFDIDLNESEDVRATMTYKQKIGFVRKSLDMLAGFLVVKGKDLLFDEVVYRFNHSSIYDAVGLLYGKVTPIGYIQNCPRKFLSYLTTSKTAANMIVITSDLYSHMLERLIREFECDGYICNHCSIGSLDVWKDPVFVERFARLLSDKKVDKLAVLNKACSFGAEECALYLLGEGVEPDQETPFYVVRGESMNVLRELLKYDVIPTARDVYNYSNVLHRACEQGREDMVAILCDAYPELVHDLDKFGQSPLYIAAEIGNCSMFHAVERTILESLCRVEDERHRCESVDGRVVHRNCACAQYMSGLVNDYGSTVFHVNYARGHGQLCTYLCHSYPALISVVDV